jgi:hypothetical protein
MGKSSIKIFMRANPDPGDCVPLKDADGTVVSADANCPEMGITT